MDAWCHMKLLPSRCVLHGGGTNTEIRVSSESRLWRTFSHRSCRDSNQRPFNHESGALTTELSPLPISVDYSANLWRLAVRWQENEWLQLRKPVSRYRNISVILNYGSLASWQEDRLARNGRFSSSTAAPDCTQIKPANAFFSWAHLRLGCVCKVWGINYPQRLRTLCLFTLTLTDESLIQYGRSS